VFVDKQTFKGSEVFTTVKHFFNKNMSIANLLGVAA